MADTPTTESTCLELEHRLISVRVPRSDGSVTEGGSIHRIDSPMITLQWMENGSPRTKTVHLVYYWFVNQYNWFLTQHKWVYSYIKFVEINPGAPEDEKKLLCTELFYVESRSAKVASVGSHWFSFTPKTHRVRPVYITEFCKLVHEGKIDESVIARYREEKIRLESVYDHAAIVESKTLGQHLEEKIRL